MTYPDTPGYVNGSDTSKEAADKLTARRLRELHDLVYKLIKESCPRGLTDEELDDLSGQTHTVRPRRIELMHRRLVIYSGRKEKNKSSGRKAKLWVIRTRTIERQQQQRKRTIPRQELNGD